MSRSGQRKLVGKVTKRATAGAFFAAAAVATSGGGSTAFAAQHVYTPAGSSDLWSAGTNWSAAPVSGADTQLTFVGDNTTVLTAGSASTSNNDLAGNFLLNILDLQGTGPVSGTAPTVSISGNPLELVVNGATTPVVNLNAVTGPVTIGYTVGNNLVLTNNAAITGNGNAGFTFSGAVSGAGSLSKSGLSTALLTGSNSYSGGTTVSGGILRTSQAASLPGYNAAGQVVVNGGATLSVIAGGAAQWTDVEVGSLLSSATFNSGSQLGVQVDTGNTLTYASNITNPIGVTKSGGGTLALSGSNSYTGGTTIAGGVLRVSDAANFGGPSSSINFTGGVLQVQGTALTNLNGNTVNAATFNGGFDIADGGNTFTFSQSISGPGGLSKAGPGTLVLSGTNTHTGTNSLSTGTLVVTDGTQLGSGNLNLGNATTAATLQITGASATINSPVIPMDGNGVAPVTVNAAGSVDFTGIVKATEANAVMNINSVGTTTFSGQVHTSDNSSARTLRIGGSGNVLISGVVSNGTGGATSGGLGYTGSGKLTLTGTNTFAGTTFVTNGTVSITNGSQLGTSRIQWGEAGTTASPVLEITGVGPLTINNGILIRTGTTTPGILSAATPINFTGAMSANTGTAVLNINNTSTTTFSGTVPISDGASNRTIRLGGSGNVLISGTVSNTATSGGVGSLFYTGTGTLTLSGNNTHTGVTTLNTGTLAITSGSALGGNGRLDLGSNGAGSAATTFQVTGASPVTITNQTYIRGGTGTAATLQAATPVTFSGALSAATGSAFFNVDNTALTTLSNVQISEGTSNRTLRFGGSGNILMNGTVSNSPSTGVGSLAYDGTGTLTVSGAASYTGSTAATSGKLAFQNSFTTSSSVTASGTGTIELASGGGSNRVIKTGAVSATGTGKIDIRDNKLITTTTPGTESAGVYSGVQGLVQSASNGGAWDGPGLTTSMPDAVNGLTSIGVATGEQVLGLGPTDTALFAGQTINGASTIAMYTYAGDANLDGFISGDDYASIDGNVSTPGADGWYNGDFNYDGIVSGDDYAFIDGNIVAQGAPFPTSGSAGLSGVTAVPEPASIGVIALAVAANALGTRRRRQ